MAALISGVGNKSTTPFLPASTSRIRPEPTPLRPAQAQEPRLVAARWLPLRLSPHTERGPSGAALPVLPQAAPRPARQQPFPSPPRHHLPAGQQTRNRLPPRLTKPSNRSSTCLPPDASDCSTLLAYDFPG